MRRRALPASICAAAWFAGSAACASRRARTDGQTLVAEVVSPGHAAHRAGLREGDVLAIPSLPALAALARRSVTGEDITVRRLRPMPGELSLPKAEWGLEARPPLSAGDEAGHAAARQAFRDGRFDQAERRWADLASRRLSAGDSAGGVFFHLRRGQALLGSRQLESARAAARRALDAARAGGEPLEAWAWEAWGDALGRANQPLLADEAYESALAHTDEVDGIGRATLLQKRAVASFRRNRFEEAKGLAQTALDVWARTAPNSGAYAGTLLTLARVERNHSRYDQAVALADRALSAARAADPGGPVEAAAVSEYGWIAYRQGRQDDEERWQQKALELYERLGVRDLDLGRVHVLLGNAAYRRGDVAAAEERFRAGLEIFESESPESLHVGWALLGLGDVLMARGDLEGAEQAYRRSVAIRAALVPGAPDHAVSLQNLGLVTRARGDLEGAEQAFREALDIMERTLKETLDRAILFANLGEVVAARGRFDEARALLARALELHEVGAPRGLYHADSLHALGALEQRAGRPAEAERAYREALAIRGRLARGSAVEAETLYALGVLERRGGRREQAVKTLRRSVAALEAQRARLGGTPEDRARFSATYAHVHKELLDLLLELGRGQDAFDLLERYRVGSLGTLIAQRDLQAGARSKLAALGYPRPPDLAQTASLLGEGTLLLSFAVLPDRTVLFTLPGGKGSPVLEVHTLSLTELRLRQETETLRDLVQSPRAPAEGRAALRRRLRGLHDELLGSVRGLVARSRRLLVLPDGPLHLVPFGALIVDDDASPRYLVEDRPVARAQAITLLAARAPLSSGAAAPLQLLAFGAPQRAPPDPPLPQARVEVEALGRIYAGDARVYVGSEASEGRAKALAGEARYLHFACHGLTNDRFPLESHLALSPGEGAKRREDGLLQAWEVCDQMKASADLVVLSACETGLGAELAGAGLLGLTYAFQFAGAHSVLASLWPVSDRSTASLMQAFHQRLRNGDPPVEALQRAQLELLAFPVPAESRLGGGLRRLLGRPWAEDLPLDGSHPYYWAAFQLITDRP